MEKIEKLKNGLTQEQVEAAREIIAQVNLKAICEKLGIPTMTVHNVLRGSSKRVDLLKRVLDAAEKEIKENQKLLKSIPSKKSKS